LKYYLRVFGWLLLGMGAVLGVLGTLGLIGLTQAPIDWFGISLDSGADRIAWTVSWLAAAAAGLALLLWTRRGSQDNSGA
jgi:hypothetical protein